MYALGRLNRVKTEEDQQRDQEEAAKVYDEFVKDFQDEESMRNHRNAPVFVKAGEPSSVVGGISVLSKPNDRNSAKKSHGLVRAFDTSSDSGDDEKQFIRQPVPSKPTPGGFFGQSSNHKDSKSGASSRSRGKKVREIEILMDELKQKHGEGDRMKPLSALQEMLPHHSGRNSPLPLRDDTSQSTVLYLRSISPAITEDRLARKFSEFGRVSSVKIVSENDGRSRDFPSAYISFTNRHDAEKAMDCMDGILWNGVQLKIEWGKAMMSQRIMEDAVAMKTADDTPRPVIYIKFPESQLVKNAIDAFSRYVCDYGYPIEQAIMQKIIDDGRVQQFPWLFDQNCTDHYYYRWRVYSFINGQSLRHWNEDIFTISPDSLVSYKPPPCSGGISVRSYKRRKMDHQNEDYNFGTWGTDEELIYESSKLLEMKLKIDEIDEPEDIIKDRYGVLLGPRLMTPPCLEWISSMKDKFDSNRGIAKESMSTRDLKEQETKHLKLLLRHATTRRKYVSSVMTWALDRPACAPCITNILIESLLMHDTPWKIKLARFYIMYDILANTGSAVIGGSQYYRTTFETVLPRVFHHFNVYCKKNNAAEFYRGAVRVIQAMEQRLIFPSMFLQGLICCLNYDQTASISDLLLHPSLCNTPKSIVTESVAILEGGQLLDDSLRAYLNTVPAWLRRNMLEYLTKDVLTLCRLVHQRGMILGMNSRMRERRSLIETPPKLTCTIDSKKVESITSIELPPTLTNPMSAPPSVQAEIKLRTMAIESLVLWESFWFTEIMKQEEIIDKIAIKHPSVAATHMVAQPLLLRNSIDRISRPLTVSPSNWNGAVALDQWRIPYHYSENSGTEIREATIRKDSDDSLDDLERLL